MVTWQTIVAGLGTLALVGALFAYVLALQCRDCGRVGKHSRWCAWRSP